MNLSKILLIVFVMTAVQSFAQEKMLHGRAVSDSVSVQGINVINMVNETATMTNERGEFSIMAKPGDLLVLASPNFEYRRRLVEPQDFEQSMTVMEIPKTIELDEVVITRTDKPDDLIMRHKDHRDFTPAERKLYTAQSGPVDIIANLITGRTAMLKKELKAEMGERLLARLEVQFEDDYYVQSLKIPQDYIRGFQYYVIEDSEFVMALKAKNKTMMRFLAGKLALNYLALIPDQKR